MFVGLVQNSFCVHAICNFLNWRNLPRLLLWEIFKKMFKTANFKVTVMQIEKALIEDRLRVSKTSWKFCVPTAFNFAVIYLWNLLLLSWKVAYFIKVFLLPFLFVNKTLRFSNLKCRIAMRKLQCLLFVVKQSYICHFIICMTVPLRTVWLYLFWVARNGCFWLNPFSCTLGNSSSWYNVILHYALFSVALHIITLYLTLM